MPHDILLIQWPAYNLTTTAHVRLFNCKAIERGTLRRVRASSGTG
jgi:hypothetical protein